MSCQNVKVKAHVIRPDHIRQILIQAGADSHLIDNIPEEGVFANLNKNIEIYSIGQTFFFLDEVNHMIEIMVIDQANKELYIVLENICQGYLRMLGIKDSDLL